MSRIKGWRPALYKALDVYRGKGFRWGERDCALLAADAVLAMTLDDLAAPYRGKYASAIAAQVLLEENGFADAIDLAASRFTEIPVAKAGVGDLAAVPAGSNSAPVEMRGVGALALGVVTGPVVQVMAPGGLIAVPLEAAVRAFRVE